MVNMIKKYIYQLILFFIFVPSSLANTPNDSFVMAWRIADLTTLDPAEIFEFTGLEYAANTYERLFRYNSDNPELIQGELVDSWQISPDKKTYTFKLKPNIKFASGNDLTADDVVFSLQRVIKLNKSPAMTLKQFGFNEDNTAELIKAIDNYTVQLTTDRTYSSSLLFYCLSTSVASIVDKKLLLQHEVEGDLGNEWLKTHYAGSGPFILSRWKANEILSLEANKLYHDSSPKIKRVIIRHVPEITTQQLLIQKGDVDVARNINLKDINQNENLKILSTPKSWLMYLGLNQKNKYLQLPQVQEALRWLIDYQSIAEHILPKQSHVHQSIIPKGIFASLEITPYHLDFEKAKSLLKSIGLEQGFHITIDAANLEIAQILQATFAKANIHLEIIPGDSKQILTKYRARNHDIVLTNWGMDYLDPHANTSTFAYNADNSDQSNDKTVAWRNSWYSEEMNKLTLAGLYESDNKKRKEIYLSIQHKMQNNSPVIVLIQSMEVAVLRNNVKGFLLGPSADSTKYYLIEKS